MKRIYINKNIDQERRLEYKKLTKEELIDKLLDMEEDLIDCRMESIEEYS